MFNLIAPFYDPAMRLANVTHERAVKLLAPDAADLVLDLGGGTAIGAKTAVALTGCRALVVDRSRSMLRRAKVDGRVNLVLADAIDLPLVSNSVDRALILDALHHFPRPVAALKEVGRVLRPGGRLVVEELDATRLPIRILGRLEALLREPGTLWSQGELLALVGQSGLEVADMLVEGGLVFAVLEKASQSGGSR